MKKSQEDLGVKELYYQRFAEEFVETGQATASYRAAFPKRKNKPNETLHVEAWRLLRNVKVKAMIEQIRVERRKKLDISKERILEEYAKIGFSDIRQIFDSKNKLKKITDLNNDIAGAIQSVEVQEKKISNDGGEVADKISITKIKLADKKAALDKLAQFSGLFEEPVPMTPIQNNYTQINVQNSNSSELSELAKHLAFILRSGTEIKQ